MYSKWPFSERGAYVVKKVFSLLRHNFFKVKKPGSCSCEVMLAFGTHSLLCNVPYKMSARPKNRTVEKLEGDADYSSSACK